MENAVLKPHSSRKEERSVNTIVQCIWNVKSNWLYNCNHAIYCHLLLRSHMERQDSVMYTIINGCVKPNIPQTLQVKVWLQVHAHQSCFPAQATSVKVYSCANGGYTTGFMYPVQQVLEHTHTA